MQRIKPNAPAAAPSARVAPIAAGEKVVASMDSPEYKALRNYASDAVAVEMEGYGFLAGAQMNHVAGSASVHVPGRRGRWNE